MMHDTGALVGFFVRHWQARDMTYTSKTRNLLPTLSNPPTSSWISCLPHSNPAMNNISGVDYVALTTIIRELGIESSWSASRGPWRPPKTRYERTQLHSVRSITRHRSVCTSSATQVLITFSMNLLTLVDPRIWWSPELGLYFLCRHWSCVDSHSDHSRHFSPWIYSSSSKIQEHICTTNVLSYHLTQVRRSIEWMIGTCLC